jgi:hypothetical protein
VLGLLVPRFTDLDPVQQVLWRLGVVEAEPMYALLANHGLMPARTLMVIGDLASAEHRELVMRMMGSQWLIRCLVTALRKETKPAVAVLPVFLDHEGRDLCSQRWPDLAEEIYQPVGDAMPILLHDRYDATTVVWGQDVWDGEFEA